MKNRLRHINVLVFSGYGLNSEEELAFAFTLAGARARIEHINDLISTPSKLKRYQIIAFPGGFAYGDDTGSGNAYAAKVRNHLWDRIHSFISGDRLVLGVCNGFQILVHLGLFGQVALLPNDSMRYTVRWTDVRNESDSPWLTGVTELMLPIAHGEGKLYAPKMNGMIALRYVHGEICDYQNIPANPTGTADNICGITDGTGKIFGLMPHPERAMFFTQLPHWTYLKEKLVRAGKPVPKEGPGLAIFRNAVRYFQ